MRKWLRSLPTALVIKISHDLGYEGQHPYEAIDFIMESAKAHRFRVADFEARYKLDLESLHRSVS